MHTEGMEMDVIIEKVGKHGYDIYICAYVMYVMLPAYCIKCRGGAEVHSYLCP
jgi:hypothetical protein